MKKQITIWLLAFSLLGVAIYFKPQPQYIMVIGGMPDVPVPGVLNPNVTQATIYQTICVPGWTATIRPSVAYTNVLKIKQISNFGYVTTGKLFAPAAFEEDHAISLELGGDPSSPDNLWPQPYPEATAKDKVESALHRDLCSGKITLAQAQDMVRHWKSYTVAATLGGVESIVYDEDDN